MDVLSIVGGILTLIGVIITGVFTYINRKGGESAVRRLRQDPAFVEYAEENRGLRGDLAQQEERWEARYKRLETRVDALEEEKRLTEWASRSLLYDAYGQWPADLSAPVFDKDALDAIPHLIHPSWRFNYRVA